MKKNLYLERNDPLWQALAEIAADEGAQIYDIERLARGGLRIFLEKVTGVTSGECTNFCRRLMAFFSVEGPNYGFGTDPELEVSSPGINRRLRLPEHYQNAVGSRVKIKWKRLAHDPREEAREEVREEEGQGGEQHLKGDTRQAGMLLSKVEVVVGLMNGLQGECVDLSVENTSEVLKIPLSEIQDASVDYKF